MAKIVWNDEFIVSDEDKTKEFCLGVDEAGRGPGSVPNKKLTNFIGLMLKA
jgi:hypothetical protein